MKRQKEPSPKPARAAGARFPVLQWLGLVFVLPAVIYVTWVFGQLREIEARNLRQLGLGADRIAESLRLARKNVESLGEDLSSALDVVDRQPHLWLDEAGDKESLETLRKLQQWSRQEVLPESVDLETWYTIDFDDTVLVAEFTAAASEDAELAELEEYLSELREESRQEGLSQKDKQELLEEIAFWEPLREEIKAAGQSVRGFFGIPEDSSEPGSRRVRLHVRTDALIEGRTYDAAFEHLLLVSNEGRVLGQASPIVPFQDRPAGHRVLEADFLEIEERALLDGEKDGGAKELLDSSELGSASSSRRIKLAGGSYALLCQPFRVEGYRKSEPAGPGRPAGAQGAAATLQQSLTRSGQTTWSLCGLASPRRNLRQALSVAPHFALGLLLFLIMGLLAGPFAKLVLMHRRERLRFVDAFLLVVATFASLLILPILLIDGDTYLGLRYRQRGTLERLARQLDESLESHLRAQYAELDRYDEEACRLKQSPVQRRFRQQVEDTGDFGALDRVRDISLFVEPDQRLSPQTYGRYSGVASLPAACHDGFQSVFWMEPFGSQVAKATTRAVNTPPVPLADRDYFRAIRDGDAWPAPAAWDNEIAKLRRGLCGAGSADEAAQSSAAAEGGETANQEADSAAPRGPGEFFFQTYASATTGERSMALSIPSRLSDPRPDGDCSRAARREELPDNSIWVAAMTSRPLWLLEPALPPGIAFAIVDESGRSLFHSVDSRALQENLFDELSSHRHLRSAMMARAATHFSGRYRARPHQVFVQPARSVPWWIVTLADNELAGAVNLEALAQGAVGAFWYALALNVLFIIAYAVTRRRGGAVFLWPDRKKRHLHRQLFWTTLVAVIVFVFLIGLQDGEPLHVAAFWLPAVGMGLNLLLIFLWWADARIEKRLPERVKPFWGRRSIFRQRGEVTAGQLRWHLAAVVAIWVLVAVLPGMALFKAAWDDQITSLLKLEGVELVASLEDRADWLEAEYGSTEFADDGPLSRQQVLARRWRELSEVHEAASLFDTTFADEIPAGGQEQRREVQQAGESEGKPLEGLRMAGALARYKPIYNPTVGGLRHLRDAASKHRKYRWWLSPDESSVQLAAAPTSFPIVSAWSGRPGVRVGAMTVFGTLLLLAVLLFWIRWSTLRIFFARIGSRVGEAGYTLEQLDQIDRPVIALVPSPVDRRRLVTTGGREVVDLRPADHQAAEAKIAQLEAGARQQVVCVNFGVKLEDAAERQWKIEQLEELVYRKRRRVVLRTAANPLEDLFWARSAGEDKPAEDGPPVRLPGQAPISMGAVEAQRWGRLLSEFVVFPVTARPPRLEEVDLKELFEAGLPRGVGRRQEALERKLELFEGFYWALWTSCSPDEQLVLVQLAQENFVNPKQEPAVRRLLQKGLLKRDPRLQLLDDAFDLFVRRIHIPLEIARRERSGHGFGWQQLRWGFFSLLTVVAVFLIATQQELVDVTLGFVSALLVGGLPGIIELFSRVRRFGWRGGGG